jgi:UDP-GlcNAc:undecaprenyl-phosphate GlcNAc-1-phosphate transferase
MPGILSTGLLAFAVSLALTAVAARAARRFGIVAEPRADRWHRRQVPLLGGLAMAATVVVGTALARVRDPFVWILIGGGLALAAAGLVDDLRSLKPQTKFVVQILVASALTGLGLRLALTGLPMLDLLLTIAWMVGITNAFNLLDNMDGLAAGIAAIATLFHLSFLLADGNLEAATFAAVFLGALLGFLVLNVHPARIFMGDTGSLFVGLVVSGLSLVGSWPYSRGVVSVLVLPVLTLLVPIFDTALVSVARTLAGRSVATGGRDHSSHRLVALGLSEREAVLLLYLVSLVSGGVAFFSYRYGLSYGAVLVALLLIGLVLFGVYLGRLRVYPESEAQRAEGARFVRLIAGFPYTRQVAAVAVDLALIAVAYYAAYVLRFEHNFPREQPLLIQSFPIVLVCQLLAFASFRLYQGIWRYTGLRDLLRLVQAASIGTLAAVVVLLFLFRFAGYSRAVFVLDWLLLIVLVSASRLSFRALSEILRPAGTDLRRVVIYGAGDGGVMVLREILNNRELGRTAVAFLDDDRSKHRTTILGVPVVGGSERLEEIVRGRDVAEVIVSSQKVPPERFAAIARRCEALGIPCVRASLRWE